MAATTTTTTTTATTTPIFSLPDELLESIVSYLPPAATLACGYTSSRLNKITYEPLVWRRHCIQRWKFWSARHNLDANLLRPPFQTKWRQLFHEREKTDQDALEMFNAMLKTQRHRISRMETLAGYGYDVKDLMRRIRDETEEDAEDVLARRFHAKAILGQIHRATALEKWTLLQQRRTVKLEEVLGAYDMFVLSGERGDMKQIARELDRLAEGVRGSHTDFDARSTRRKAVEIAQYLREQTLMGNASEENYHALRNNFISLALFDEPHTSLPLQSVAIYCAVARRLGVNAQPSNYPHHVHAVIEAPTNHTLDGVYRDPSRNTNGDIDGADHAGEAMHMDPWRSSAEVPQETLKLRLLQMGAPAAQHARHLGPTSTLEVALRTGRNIMTSVQDKRERQRQRTGSTSTSTPQDPDPDVEASWYSMLWSMVILGDHSPASSLHRRTQCLPYLIEHLQAHFPEDLGLAERHLPHLFLGQSEHQYLLQFITTARAADDNQKAPNPRLVQRPNRHPSAGDGLSLQTESYTLPVKYKIGTHFHHRRFGYEGVIVGWDVKCSTDPRWMAQIGVDELPTRRAQPFYTVVSDDRSVSYVAEENILEQKGGRVPGGEIMKVAGRWFLRWDRGLGRFVSNLREEYPDD